MPTIIHGFRTFSFRHCTKTNKLVLAGFRGMHLHNRIQKAAVCTDPGPAMWMTEAARSYPFHTGRHDDEPAPKWECSCGHYFYRTYRAAWNGHFNVYAHVTALEKTMLHRDGGRTTQYAVDYLITPEHPQNKAYIPYDDTKNTPPGIVQAGRVPVPFAGGIPGFWGFTTSYQKNMLEAVETVANDLGVPVLEKNDLAGCPVCLEVNGWREPDEITTEMKIDWFGEYGKEI